MSVTLWGWIWIALHAATPLFQCQWEGGGKLIMTGERGTFHPPGKPACEVRVLDSERVVRGHMPGVSLRLAASQCKTGVNPLQLAVKQAGPTPHARLLWSRKHPVARCQITTLNQKLWYPLLR